jgi:hypothetical protein
MYITPIQTGDILAKTANSIVDQFKQEAEKQQKRAQLTTSYGTIAEQMGFDKNLIKTLSLEQRMGLVEGRKEQAALEQQQHTRAIQDRQMAVQERNAALNEQTTQNTIETMRQQREQMAYLQSQQRAQQAFYRDLARYAPVGQLERPLTQEQSQYEMAPGQTAPSIMQMLQSAGRTGYNIPPAVLDDMYRALNPAAGRSTLFGPSDMFKMRNVLDEDGNVVPNIGVLPTGPNSSQVLDSQGKPTQVDLTFDPNGPPTTRNGKFWFQPKTGEYRAVNEGNPWMEAFTQALLRGAGVTNGLQPGLQVQNVPAVTNAAPVQKVVKDAKTGKWVVIEDQVSTNNAKAR